MWYVISFAAGAACYHFLIMPFAQQEIRMYKWLWHKADQRLKQLTFFKPKLRAP